MKLVIVLLFAFILNIQMFPQDGSSYILYWGERELTWEDFLDIPPRSSEYISEINYAIGYRTYDKDLGEMNVKWIETYAYMDRGSSWVKENSKNEETLLYNKTIFNMAELFSRKLQDEINNLSGSTFEIKERIDELLREYYSRLKNGLSIVYDDTDGGQDYERIEYWYNKTKLELKQQERNLIPDYKLSRFGLGLSFDLGYGIINGNVSNYFSNNFNLAFGFDVAYKPMVFYLRAILGFNYIKNEFIYNNNKWTKELNTGLAIPELTVGYPLIGNEDFTITPFGGIGVVEFSVRSKDDAFKDYVASDFTEVFGFNFDFNFSRTLNLLQDFIFREKSNWLVRARLTFAPFNLNDQLKGWSINFTVGFGGFTNKVNL